MFPFFSSLVVARNRTLTADFLLNWQLFRQSGRLYYGLSSSKTQSTFMRMVPDCESTTRIVLEINEVCGCATLALRRRQSPHGPQSARGHV